MNVPGKMLDQAAEYLSVKQPNLTTEEVRTQLSPEEFLKTHTNLGGANPDETLRLLKIRAKIMAEAEKRQQVRRDKINKAILDLGKRSKEGNPV